MEDKPPRKDDSPRRKYGELVYRLSVVIDSISWAVGIKPKHVVLLSIVLFFLVIGGCSTGVIILFTGNPLMADRSSYGSVNADDRFDAEGDYVWSDEEDADGNRPDSTGLVRGSGAAAMRKRSSGGSGGGLSGMWQRAKSLLSGRKSYPERRPSKEFLPKRSTFTVEGRTSPPPKKKKLTGLKMDRPEFATQNTPEKHTEANMKVPDAKKSGGEMIGADGQNLATQGLEKIPEVGPGHAVLDLAGEMKNKDQVSSREDKKSVGEPTGTQGFEGDKAWDITLDPAKAYNMDEGGVLATPATDIGSGQKTQTEVPSPQPSSQ